MKRSQMRDACRQQSFYFRCNVLPAGFSLTDDTLDLEKQTEDCAYEMDDSDALVELMSIDEIFNGSDRFAGLIPIIRKYLRVTNSRPASPATRSPRNSTVSFGSSGCDNHENQLSQQRAISLDDKTNAVLERHLDFIGKKASGALPTVAQLLRRFVRTHPEYHDDSKVSQRIGYDLCKLAASFASGELSEADLSLDYEFFAQR